jgi:hypothetical protein
MAAAALAEVEFVEDHPVDGGALAPPRPLAYREPIRVDRFAVHAGPLYGQKHRTVRHL